MYTKMKGQKMKGRGKRAIKQLYVKAFDKHRWH